MAKKYKIKTGDTVQAIAGESKGQEGKVQKIHTKNTKAIVEGLNLVSKHEKPSASNPQGGIKEMEAPIDISNLSLLDKKGNPTRVGYRMKDGKKVRVAKTTNEDI